MLLRAVAMLALALFGAAEAANAQGADTTLVNTPSKGANPPGSLVNGNLVKAAGPHGVTDSGIAGANVDLLNAAQSATALKTFSGGLALPSGSNPSGSNFYADSNGNLHFVSSFMDAQLVGGKFAGDSSRPWFLSPTGSGITETSSGQQPNWTLDRNEYYNGGSGLTFNATAQTNVGKGWNVTTTADFATGTTTITVAANANIAAGQNVSGPCIAASTTVSSYSLGTVVLSSVLTCNLPSGSTVSFTPTANNAPGNAHNVGQYTLNSYTTGSTGSGVALGAYAFGFGTGSSQILFGANILARDLSGRKSSVSRSGLLASEFDLVASGPDDGVNRILQDWVFAENGPSADGATTFSGAARCRPSAANAQNTPNGVEIGYCFGATTMTSQPNGGTGQYGKIDKPFWADSCAVSCFEIDGGLLIFQTVASASSGQPDLVFALGTNVNPGQLVSAANVPLGTTVTAVYQCFATQPLSGCGGATNETLIVLSANLTGTLVSGAGVTFKATIPDGALWSANFNDAFFNLTNTNGAGLVKYGSTNNTGTVATITGFGEDTTNTTGIGYGSINFKITTNTHGATAGEINMGGGATGVTIGSPAGANEGSNSLNVQGSIYENGIALGANAFTSTAYAPLASPTFTGTVTLPDGTACATSCTWSSAIAMGNHGLTGVNGVVSNNSSGSEILSSATSSTVPTLIPNRGDTKAGIGADASGDVSGTVDVSGTATETLRLSPLGIVLEHGSYYSGATAGLTCSGTPSSSFATTNGIVTHC